MPIRRSLLLTTCSAAVLAASAAPVAADQPKTVQAPQADAAEAQSADERAVLAKREEQPDLSATPSAALFQNLLPAEGLEGWVVQEGKPASWLREGEIVSCISAAGGWLRTEKAYSDFVLQLEYRLQPGGNTGIGIRAPVAGNPTFTGMEIQLLDDSSPKYADLRPDQYTGSIYYQVPVQHRAELNPAGEWNSCEIRCSGDDLTVRINGQIVNEVHLVRGEGKGSGDAAREFDLSQRPPFGHIALQSHSTRVDFRNIRLRDLAVQTGTGLQYVDLADGSGEPVSSESTVTVHYVGQLADGKRFTDTRDVGQPVTVPLAAVIPGWKEGIRGMRVGGRRRLIVPPQLGYGADGVADLIPPDSTLVFEVELCSFEQ